MTIRAAVLRAPGEPIRVESLDLSPPKAGEVLVKVAAAGVCHSDWHLVTGDTRHPMPAVLGHEGAGTVAAFGDGVEGLELGQLVALSWAPSCGGCYYCGAGRPNLCETFVGPIWAGTMLDGTPRLSQNGQPIFHYSALACFAEYAVVPAVCCVPMPEGIPAEVAAVVGCAVTTGVGSVLNTAKVAPGQSAVVFGVGGVGLSTVMGAKLAGADPIVAVDPLPSRRDAAIDLGATHAASPEESIALVRSLTGGRGADVVFEASGLPRVQELAFELVRPGGTLVLSGLAPMGSGTNLPGALIVRQEKTVMGSYYGTADPPVDFPRYAEWYRQGKLPLDRLISRRYPLDEVGPAFEDMLAGRTRRGVIHF